MSTIGTLGEHSLHADLKEWYGRSPGQVETEVDGYVIDVLQDDLLIEIQTGNFTAIRDKLAALLPRRRVKLVYPVAQAKWIVKESDAGAFLERRKSPKRGKALDVFTELVRIPHLLAEPNLTLEVLLTHQEEVRRDDGRGSWRRKGWSIYDRRLLQVVEAVTLVGLDDLVGMLPAELPRPFTNRRLAEALSGRHRMRLAQKITYTLRHSGGLELVGKEGRAHLYDLK